MLHHETFKPIRSNAQLQEQLTGRQLKIGPWDTVCLWHIQLGGFTAVQLRERMRRLQVEDSQLHMWHLIRVYEESKISRTVKICFGCTEIFLLKREL